MHQQSVLQLDIQGTPQRWISLEQAALHYATDDVAWQEGSSPLATLRGGFNVARGEMSRIDVAPIIALRGAASINLFDIVPTVTKRRLCVRDRATCGYCGVVFAECDLEIEHILPASRGGPFTWQNLTCACQQSPQAAFVAGLSQPYAVRATLVRGTAQKGRVIVGLRATPNEGKVIPTSPLSELEAQFNVGEASHAAPKDHIAWWRVARPRQIAPEPGQLIQAVRH